MYCQIYSQYDSQFSVVIYPCLNTLQFKLYTWDTNLNQTYWYFPKGCSFFMFFLMRLFLIIHVYSLQSRYIFICLNLQHSFLSLHDTVLNTSHGIAHMSSSSQSSKETTIAYFWILKVLWHTVLGYAISHVYSVLLWLKTLKYICNINVSEEKIKNLC